MNDLRLTKPPTMQTGMLIRKPAAEVFRAFVDPEVTACFWFTKGSAPLEAGRTVEWTWEMYSFSISVTAKVVEPGERLVIEWPGYGSGPTTVEWRFMSRPDGTFVEITETGFQGDGDVLVKHVTDS